MSKEKIETTMNFLSRAYADPQVKGNPELADMLLKAAKDLDKHGTVDLIAAQLCDQISIYALGHRLDCPEAIITLFHQLKSDDAIYKGIALSCMMLPVWF